MAAIITTIKGKVLIQIPGSEPVEVGEIEIPIHASTSAIPKARGREVSSAQVSITQTIISPVTEAPEITRARAGEQITIDGVTRKAAVDTFRKLAESAGDDATVSITNGSERITYPSGGSIRVRAVSDLGFDLYPTDTR